MKSMTGYGKGEASAEGQLVRAEIKTVNHRFLDLSIRGPQLLMSHETTVRREVKAHILRGHVEVYLTYASDSVGGTIPVVDLARVEALAKAARIVSEVAHCSEGLRAVDILNMQDVVAFQSSPANAERAGALAVSAVRLACEQVDAARQLEGTALWDDVLQHVEQLEVLAVQIAEREPHIIKEYSDRITGRIRELTSDAPAVDQNRITQEVAIFADRCNVNEEVVRIRAHLARLRSASSQTAAQGRKLDFIAQELNREFNTIGSKSQDTILTDCVLDAKSEVEKIREQIQNIE